jgi:hypothetical protein
MDHDDPSNLVLDRVGGDPAVPSRSARARTDRAGDRSGMVRHDLSRPCRRASPVAMGLVGLAAATIASAATTGEETRHPQDGPHCEVVMRIRESGVEVRLSPNLVFIDAVVDFPREDPGNIAPSEVWTLRDLLAERFATPSGFPLISIDGRTPSPTMGEILVNDPDPDLLSLFPLNGMRGLRKIAFTLEYPTDGVPEEVAIRWRDFPPNELSLLEEPPPLVITVELLAPGERDLVDLRAEEPEFIWHRPPPDEAEAAALAAPAAPPAPKVRTVALLPVVAVGAAALLAATLLQRRGWRRGIAGVAVVLAAGTSLAWFGRDVWRVTIAREEAPLPSESDAAAIFVPLQRGIYRAFDLDGEEEVYDALASCVDGPLLPRIYRTVRRSLIMEEEGGAVGRVIEVRPLEVDVESIGLVEPPAAGDAEIATDANADERDPRRVGFTVRCLWEVDGAVYHWGHGHFRTNEYEGRYLVIATDEGWRIAGDELLSQRRIDETETTPDPEPEIEQIAPVDEDGTFEI